LRCQVQISAKLFLARAVVPEQTAATNQLWLVRSQGITDDLIKDAADLGVAGDAHDGFFKYSESLNVGAEGFAQSGPPPDSIFTMTTPSHMLLNNDGAVIRVWPGSYKDKPVRDRMARQILADTSVVLDTLNAVATRDEKP